jgi:hypothetical protein
LPINEKELLFWDNGRSPKLNRLDLKKDLLIKSGPSNPASFRSVRVFADQVYSVDVNGGVRVWNLNDFKPLASFNAQRAVCAAPGPSGYLLIGQGASNPDETTLQSINVKTNETIPLNSTGTMLFQGISDLRNRWFLSLSVASTDSKQQVTRWQYQPLDDMTKNDSTTTMKTILEMNGEDSGGDLAISADSSRFYTSMGGLVISAWDGATLDTLEAANHSPRKLAVYRDWLMALNTDGSASLYNGLTKRLIAEIFLLKSGQILMLDRDEKWSLANRTVGTKAVSSDPKERQMVINLLGRSLDRSPEGADATQWEQTQGLDLK